MGASKHIVRDDFVDFHRYPVGSQTVVLGNGCEEDVLGVGTYKLRLRGGNTVLLHDAIYAPRIRVCLLTFVFSFFNEIRIFLLILVLMD